MPSPGSAACYNLANVFLCSHGDRRAASNGGMWVWVFSVFGGGCLVDKLDSTYAPPCGSLTHAAKSERLVTAQVIGHWFPYPDILTSFNTLAVPYVLEDAAQDAKLFFHPNERRPWQLLSDCGLRSPFLRTFRITHSSSFFKQKKSLLLLRNVVSRRPFMNSQI